MSSGFMIALVLTPVWLAVMITAMVLATPLRERARQNPSLRKRLSIIIGIVCALIVYVCLTMLVSGVMTQVAEFYWRANQPASDQPFPNLDGAYRELTLREVLPLHPPCITDAAACTQADELIHYARSDAQPGQSTSGGSVWPLEVFIIAIVTALEVGLFRLLTRPAKPVPSMASAEVS